MEKREIKFRAWTGSEMVQSHLFLVDFLDGAILNTKADDYEPDWVLMQFTGLHDVNGKEIYEGDIIQNEKGDRAIVDYHSFSCQFRPRSYYGGGVDFYYQKNEVVGNYYEHPELLHQKPDLLTTPTQGK